MTIIEHEVKKLAPEPGAKFHSRDLMHRIDGMTFERLFRGLRALAAEGKVRFTGTRCIFERLA